MIDLNAIFPTKTLRSQLIIWFLLISLLPLGWITFISYEFSKKLLISQATAHLQSLSLRQTQLIENFFNEREKDILTFAKGLLPASTKKMEQTFKQFGKNSAQYQSLNQLYRSIYAIRTEAVGYSNFILIASDGTIVFSLLSPDLIGTNLLTENNLNSSFKQLFESTRDFLEVQLSNFIYYSPTEPPASFVAAPIIDVTFAGVMIAQIDNSAIYKLLTDYRGLGETGETILVTEMDGQLVSIAPLRYQENKEPMQLIPEPTPFSHFIDQVLQGKRIENTLIDYRGKESLMVGRYMLPGLNWGIITKLDTEELLAPINRLKFWSFMMALTTALIVMLAASAVARAIAYPLLVLTRKTKLIAAGDLSQRINVQTDDEFGRLGKSFNDMATQLDGMVKNLDTIVAKRTREYEQQNVRLEHTVEELQQAQDRLANQEKLASLGALTAGIAHEIKNPLNFINNFAELSLQIDQEMQDYLDQLKNKISNQEENELKDYLNTLKLNINKIYEHGKRADTIVKNMLQHSRGAPGEKILTDINALLDEYVTLSYHGMRAQDINFNVKLEKDYDSTLPKIPIVPQDLSRVFLNLLNNAYFSINQKKKELKDSYDPIVKVSTKHIGEFIEIKIWDNGLGISHDVFPKLFTPFFTTKPPGEGTGLGLSLSYNIIIQGHNGTLIADSEPGEFAEFVITLPLKNKQH